MRLSNLTYYFHSVVVASNDFVLILVELYLILFFGISLFLSHGSEDIIASGAGDDAICLFAEEKSSMVILPSHICFFHDFSPYVLCLAGLIKFVFTKIHHSSHNLFKLSW